MLLFYVKSNVTLLVENLLYWGNVLHHYAGFLRIGSHIYTTYIPRLMVVSHVAKKNSPHDITKSLFTHKNRATKPTFNPKFNHQRVISSVLVDHIANQPC